MLNRQDHHFPPQTHLPPKDAGNGRAEAALLLNVLNLFIFLNRR
jgi:hypothetical protein